MTGDIKLESGTSAVVTVTCESNRPFLSGAETEGRVGPTGAGSWLPGGDDAAEAGVEIDGVREGEDGKREDGFRMPCGELDACAGEDEDGVVVVVAAALLSLEGRGREGSGGSGGGGGGGGAGGRGRGWEVEADSEVLIEFERA